MSNFRDRVKADVSSVFLGQSQFEEDITYTPIATGTPAAIKALVFDEAELQDGSPEMDGVYMPTMARPVRFDLAEADITLPVYGDSITWSGNIYTVRQFALRDGMWHVSALADIKGDF